MLHLAHKTCYTRAGLSLPASPVSPSSTRHTLSLLRRPQMCSAVLSSFSSPTMPFPLFLSDSSLAFKIPTLLASMSLFWAATVLRPKVYHGHLGHGFDWFHVFFTHHQTVGSLWDSVSHAPPPRPEYRLGVHVLNERIIWGILSQSGWFGERWLASSPSMTWGLHRVGTGVCWVPPGVQHSRRHSWDLPGDPVVERLPSNAGNASLVPGHRN